MSNAALELIAASSHGARILDFIDALSESLPPGPLWNVEPDEALSYFFVGVLGEPLRIDDIIASTFPGGYLAAEFENLAEWEIVFGLPDDCAPPTFDDTARLASVRAQFLAQGGQSPAYYISLMENVFGIVGATIDEGFRRPFIVGDGQAETDIGNGLIVVCAQVGNGVTGTGIYDYVDFFDWRINIPASQVAGADVAARIECLIRRVKPAHTAVEFNYF